MGDAMWIYPSFDFLFFLRGGGGGGGAGLECRTIVQLESRVLDVRLRTCTIFPK